MNRIFNNPDLVVEDMLRGYLKVHADQVSGVENPRVVKRADAPVAGKVGIVTGGGSGHEPAFLGYVGENLVDAVAVGEIFSSPTAKSFFDAIKAADGGKGVACLYGNYAGDNMNVKMAIKMAEKDGIQVKTVVANDDVPSAPKPSGEKRRGVAGEILMWKMGGAKAAMGGTPRRGDRGGPEGHRQHPQHRHRPLRLHHPGGRQAQLPHRRRRDGGRHRPPRRAGHQAS